MSSASRYADEGNDASVPQGPPSVYLPQTPPPPAYDAYVDPAAAHGWQNAYDETRELPPVAVGEQGPPESAGGDVAPPETGGTPWSGEVPHPAGGGAPEGPGGGRPRSGSGGRGRRRAPAPPRVRPAVAVVSAVGAVSVAALIAGFAFSGSPSKGAGERDDREDVTTGRPDVPATAADASESAGGTDATGGPSAGSASPGASGSGVDPEADGSPSTPATGASTTSTPSLPTATPTVSTPPGNPGRGDGGPGRGQGPKHSR
ncbi:hypothetical protein ACIF9R_02465 [Streptomyces sp. NPDC086080]|uniref:hypothetical protein n=1 Tax=Streptomyces sp. NPDC086080 TaxID=3365748 RepID=UPI0037D30EFE